MDSCEECLIEAVECDRLAALATTSFTRNMMKVAAFHWRKLAERAAERQKVMSKSIGIGAAIQLPVWLQLAGALYV
jgi:hypothetical protein